jgi:hypothetical protein
MSWIALALAIEFGFTPGGTLIPYQPPADPMLGWEFGMIMEAEALIHDTLFFNGTAAVSTDDPRRVDFTFGAGIRLGALEIGIHHSCASPEHYASDRIYIRVEGGK